MTPKDNLRGIGLMTGSMALFAIEDMFLKFSTRVLPTGEILLITCLIGMVFFSALAIAGGKAGPQDLARHRLPHCETVRGIGHSRTPRIRRRSRAV